MEEEEVFSNLVMMKDDYILTVRDTAFNIEKYYDDFNLSFPKISIHLVFNYTVLSLFQFTPFITENYDLMFIESTDNSSFGFLLEDLELMKQIINVTSLQYNNEIFIDNSILQYILKYHQSEKNILLLPFNYIRDFSFDSIISVHSYDINLSNRESMNDEITDANFELNNYIAEISDNNIEIIEVNEVLVNIFSTQRAKLNDLFVEYLVILIIFLIFQLILFEIFISSWMDKISNLLNPITTRGIENKKFSNISIIIYFQIHVVMSLITFSIITICKWKLLLFSPYIIISLILQFIIIYISIYIHNKQYYNNESTKIEIINLMSIIFILSALIQLQMNINTIYSILALSLAIIMLMLPKIAKLVYSFSEKIISSKFLYKNYSAKIFQIKNNQKINQVKVVSIILLVLMVLYSHNTILYNNNILVKRIGGDIGSLYDISSEMNIIDDEISSRLSYYSSSININNFELNFIDILIVIDLAQIEDVIKDKPEYNDFLRMKEDNQLSILSRGDILYYSDNYVMQEYQNISYTINIFPNIYNSSSNFIKLEKIFPGIYFREDIHSFAIVSSEKFDEMTNTTYLNLMHMYTIVNLKQISSKDDFYQHLTEIQLQNSVFKANYFKSIFHPILEKDFSVISLTSSLILILSAISAIIQFIQNNEDLKFLKKIYKIFQYRGLSSEETHHELKIIINMNHYLVTTIVTVLAIFFGNVVFWFQNYFPLNIIEWIYFIVLLLSHNLFSIRS
ncbi:MAG: hypothetical protein INQ03_24785 [Candidatus Heimdallarchaeota archaeon]|nr:hypothetical protein [Candidatus Heimdallarchaeota archaeon]